MSSLSGAEKVMVTNRGKNLHLSSDYNRTYRDVIKHGETYIMEEYLHFVETFGLFIFHDLLSSEL